MGHLETALVALYLKSFEQAEGFRVQSALQFFKVSGLGVQVRNN